MSAVVNVESLGPPRGRDLRLRIDMGKLLTLNAQGYSFRQIAKALGVSDRTVRYRFHEYTKAPPDPHYKALGEKGQKGRRRAMARRKREARAAAERQKAADAQNELVKLALLSVIFGGRPNPAPSVPPEGWNTP